MSAFIVTKTHIDSIVNYAIDMRFPIYAGKLRFDLSDIDLRDALGQLLTDANYASVNHRYEEIDKAPEYTFRRVEQISTIQFLKALKCLNYQSCEVDNWDQTEAYKAIQSMLSMGVSRLDGYEDAAWGIPEQTAKTSYICLSDLMGGGQ